MQLGSVMKKKNWIENQTSRFFAMQKESRGYKDCYSQKNQMEYFMDQNKRISDCKR